ncbi:hypothetical protein [Modestobacter sp. SYSU DS0657]
MGTTGRTSDVVVMREHIDDLVEEVLGIEDAGRRPGVEFRGTCW